MKKIDKLKKQRYDISMKIIVLETKQERNKLSKNEEKELIILKNKEKELNNRIDSIT